MTLHFRSYWLAVCLILVAATALAEGPRTPRGPTLGCSVEGVGSEGAEARFCRAIGQALGRRMRPLPDARHQKRGEALQVFHTDVQLLVALVRDGSLAGWTRLSMGDDPGKHPAAVARAFRALQRHAHLAKRESCIRLERGREPHGRDLDIVYPWTEFTRCEHRDPEILEPWQ